MKDTKTELRIFLIPEWKKEEAYLREQHKNSWKFVRVHGFCIFHFQKSEPEDMIYQLDYNPDSTSQKNEYVQMFSDCGWEYLQNYMGYSYFRKAAAEMDGTEEEIFCDDASRLDMMKRVFSGRMIPLLAIFFFIIIPQIIMQIRINTPASRNMAIFFFVMLGLYLGVFLSFAIQFLQYYKSARKI